MCGVSVMLFSFVPGENVSFLGFIFNIDCGDGRSASAPLEFIEFDVVSLIPLDSVKMSIIYLDHTIFSKCTSLGIKTSLMAFQMPLKT